MAYIDTEVVRAGKWISESKTEVVPGERCIDIHDDYGYYEYTLGIIPMSDALHCTIADTDTSNRKESAFNTALENLGLPKYFNLKEEEER